MRDHSWVWRMMMSISTLACISLISLTAPMSVVCVVVCVCGFVYNAVPCICSAFKPSILLLTHYLRHQHGSAASPAPPLQPRTPEYVPWSIDVHGGICMPGRWWWHPPFVLHMHHGQQGNAPMECYPHDEASPYPDGSLHVCVQWSVHELLRCCGGGSSPSDLGRSLLPLPHWRCFFYIISMFHVFCCCNLQNELNISRNLRPVVLAF